MGAVDDSKVFEVAFGANGGFNSGPACDWVQGVDYQGGVDRDCLVAQR